MDDLFALLGDDSDIGVRALQNFLETSLLVGFAGKGLRDKLREKEQVRQANNN